MCRFLFFLLFFISTIINAAEYNQMRVLIDQINAPQSMHLTFYAPHGFVIKKGKSKKKYLLKEPCLYLEAKDGSILAHTKPSHTSKKKISKNKLFAREKNIQIFPLKNTFLTINEKQYPGNCTIHIDTEKKAYLIINTLPLEEYVYSVLVSESYAFWPHEMQKIQAVATRTFAARHKEEALKKQRPYDIKNTIFHQRYDGTHSYHHLWDAVNETKGVVISHNNAIALTMFDACCGGIIPSKLETIDFDKAPYLKRTYRCTYCKNFSLYRWKYECSLDEFMKLIEPTPLHNTTRVYGPLQKLSIADHDGAGTVNTFEYKGKAGKTKLACHLVKNALGKGLKSKFFTLKQKKGKLFFSGKGFGHGLGLCQHGAREMIKQNYDYKKVLAFYFPNTKLVSLESLLAKKI